MCLLKLLQCLIFNTINIHENRILNCGKPFFTHNNENNGILILIKQANTQAGFIQVLQDKIQGLFQDFSRTTKIFFKYFYAQMTLLPV